MAKRRHRIFEIYECHDEAVAAMTPKNVPLTPTATTDRWALKRLAAFRSGSVISVKFTRPENDDAEAVSDLRDDFLELSQLLDRDSKVLLNFAGVHSFGTALVEELALFKQQLRMKGSRLALCCLDPPARDSFFSPPR